MKITVEFDNLEEFQKHMTAGHEKVEFSAKGLTVYPAPILVPEEPREDAARVSGICPITPDKIEAGKKTAEKAQEEPAEEEAKDSAPFEEKPQEGPKITEEYRVEVRKALATLNKMQTGNPAKALIAETGFKRLTDVPLEMLPDLMSKAQEAMNNA